MRKTQEQVKAELQARLSQYQAAQKSRRRFLLTGGALVLVCAVVLLAVMLPLSKSEPPVSEESSAASETVSTEYVLPPVRNGKNVENASLAEHYTLKTAYEAADVVALVRIGDWLEENIEYDATLYHVDVLEQYKGEPLDNFVFRQDGCSQSTYEWYPLYTGGNEVLLFLRKSMGNQMYGKKVFDYDGAYYVSLSAWVTALNVVYDDEGNQYLLERNHFMEDEYPKLTNYGADMNQMNSYYFAGRNQDKVEQFLNNAVAKDSEWGVFDYQWIFSKEDVVSLLSAYENVK